MATKQPIQPLHPFNPQAPRAQSQKLAYSANMVVKYLFENCGIPAISNLMAMEFPISDKEQFCQLLGCTFKQCVEFGFSPDAKEVPTLAKSRYNHIRNKIQLESNEGTEWYRTFHLTPRPIQPLIVDEKRGLIFKENAIVTYLLDNNPKWAHIQ